MGALAVGRFRARRVEDIYPEEMWAQAGRYFSSLSSASALPGGRFACAQVATLGTTSNHMVVSQDAAGL